MATKKTIKNSGVKALEATEEQIESFISRLDSFLKNNLKRILKDIRTGELSGFAAAQALGGLQDSLNKAGLKKELEQLTKIYSKELTLIKNQLETNLGKKVLYNNVDIKITEQLIKFDTELLEGRVKSTVDDLRSQIMRSVLSKTDLDLNASIDDLTTSTAKEAKTVLNTALQGFNRSVNLSKAEDLGLEKFLYFGPDDDITRPFCQERVDQIFTREEIAEWDNGQGLPADTYLGGYNCRHRLIAVTDELAKEL